MLPGCVAPLSLLPGTPLADHAATADSGCYNFCHHHCPHLWEQLHRAERQWRGRQRGPPGLQEARCSLAACPTAYRLSQSTCADMILTQGPPPRNGCLWGRRMAVPPSVHPCPHIPINLPGPGFSSKQRLLEGVETDAVCGLIKPATVCPWRQLSASVAAGNWRSGLTALVGAVPAEVATE